MRNLIRLFNCFLTLTVGLTSMACLVLSFESAWFVLPAIALALVFINLLDSFENDVEKYVEFLQNFSA